MKKISFWARTHKWPARIIIIISFIILDVLGIIIGVLLNDLNISLSFISLLCFCFLYALAVFMYPSKREKGQKLSSAVFYIRQKSCDFILAASAFGMFIYLGNHPEKIFQGYSSLGATIEMNTSLPKDSLSKGYKKISEFSASLKDKDGNQLKWKERKKLLKEQIRGIKKSNDLSKGDKVFLIILSVIVALGLLILLASLACNLSCNGSDFLAVVVGLGGTALIIFLFALALRSIQGKKKKKKSSSQPQPVTQ
ncbi:MAG: hypothetical protein JST10_04260 [Bacteroidetes bacterium]|nr:hypothetical protein [Bacteroidota bacterium]MBS1631771.1 hypothetical protein [Bacteroidota bacterium]